jgi:hypothetical protein
MEMDKIFIFSPAGQEKFQIYKEIQTDVSEGYTIIWDVYAVNKPSSIL